MRLGREAGAGGFVGGGVGSGGEAFVSCESAFSLSLKTVCDVVENGAVTPPPRDHCQRGTLLLSLLLLLLSLFSVL